jgi:hypothetical protein
MFAAMIIPKVINMQISTTVAETTFFLKRVALVVSKFSQLMLDGASGAQTLLKT